MLYFIGLGLSDEKDITLKGLEAIKRCDCIYLENYTSKLNVPIENLEKLYGKKITLANRNLVESRADEILDKAAANNVAFLVIGDAVAATTHIDLMIRAKEKDVKTEIIHNASILTAVGITGLQLYKFGKTTSIPFESGNVETPYDVLKSNQRAKLHTLFLLDLDPIENKFLTVTDAIRYLLKVEIKRGEKIISDNTLCIGCARISSKDQIIKAGKANKLLEHDFKQGPHCLIIPSELHFMEEEALKLWK